MTQGNPFGAKGGRWMPASKLRALDRAGRTYDQIALANERAEGWKPSRSTVKRKLEAMGMPPRHASHTDLIPWNVRIEHNNHLFRHMLEAESWRRQNPDAKPSETRRKLLSRMEELLHGRGTFMVIDYNPETGFSLVLAEEGEDIIRRPATAKALRKDIRAALRDETDADLVATALQEGLRPELLENAGRDAAADRLRRRLADRNPEDVQDPEQAPVSVPVAIKARRSTGTC